MCGCGCVCGCPCPIFFDHVMLWSFVGLVGFVVVVFVVVDDELMSMVCARCPTQSFSASFSQL